MSIKFYCEKCRKKLKVDDKSAGKQAKCSKCGNRMRIPKRSIESKPKRVQPKTSKEVEGAVSLFEDESLDRLIEETKADREPLPVAIPVAAFSATGVKVETGVGPSAEPVVFGQVVNSTADESSLALEPEVTSGAPYQTPPVRQASGQSHAYGAAGLSSIRQAFSPLQNNVFYIRLCGWALILQGALAALTVVGLVIAWLPIWMGLCLRKAASEIEAGTSTGNVASFEAASKNLSTYFVIFGIVSIISFVIASLYVVFALCVTVYAIYVAP